MASDYLIIAYDNRTGALTEPSGKAIGDAEQALEIINSLTHTYQSKKTFCALPLFDAMMVHWLEVNYHQKFPI